MKLEGHEVTTKEFLRLLISLSFYNHYLHKWVLCFFGFHDYKVATNKPVFKCIYCLDEKPAVEETKQDVIDRLLKEQKEK